MQILVIGSNESAFELSALFPNRADFHIAILASPAEALEMVDGSEPVLAALQVEEEDLSTLDRVPELTARGATVLVLASGTSPALRAAAFDAGAADVLFPPLSGRRMEAAVLSLLGRPARRETRFSAGVPAIIGAHLPGAATFKGEVVDISRGGFRARVPGTIATRTVVRIALNPPPPHRIPVLFANLLAAEPQDEQPGWTMVRARFVGITDDERKLLAGFVETLSPEAVAAPVALDALLAMDASAIADADLGAIAGMRLPALTAAERHALAVQPAGSDPLARAAVARARALMLAELVERVPPVVGAAAVRLDPEALRAEMRQAVETVRAAASAAVSGGDEEGIRDLTDLQARTTASAEALERLLGQVFGDSATRVQIKALEPVAGPAVFERPATEPEATHLPAKLAGRRSPIVTAAVVVFILLGMGSVLWTWSRTRERRAQDPALTAVATRPAMVAGTVRVRSVFPGGKGLQVAVVDGSWFAAGDQARKDAVLQILQRGSAKAPLEIRDYRARRLATVDSSGALTFYALPTAR